MSLSPQAQETNTRLLWAKSDSDGFIAHISLARGVTIESAALETLNETHELSVQPVALPSEEWLLLDASSAVSDSAPAIQAAIQNFLTNASPERQIGILHFASEIMMIDASSRPSDLQIWMQDYQAHNGESACLADALHQLAEREVNRDRARRILVVVGEYQACGDFPSSNNSDIIVIGAEIDTAYSELARQTGGNVYRASLQTLNARLNDVNNLWLNPVYAVTGEFVEEANGILNISLSNGESIRLDAQYIVEAQASPSPTIVPTEMPTIPIASESPEEVRPSETPTEEILASPAAAISEVAVIATEIASPESSLDQNSPAPIPVSNQGIIIAGGISAVIVVIIVMGLLLFGGRRRSTNNGDKLDITAVFQYNDEGELDQTDIVTMREILAQSGPTLAANLHDEESGAVYEIHRPFSTLGRKEGNDIRIENDKQISREHLRFTVRDDASIWLTRLTQNPILLNEIPVETSLQLHAGDIIQVSPSLRLKVEIIKHA